MPERRYFGSAFGAYAAAKDERQRATVCLKDIPTEPRAVAAGGLPLGVEQQEVGHGGVYRRPFYILARGNAYGLDEQYAAQRLSPERGAQVGKLPCSLVAVQLYAVEGILLGCRDDAFRRFVDEHADLQGPSLTVRHAVDCGADGLHALRRGVARTVFREYEPHHVNAKACHCERVFRLRQAANLDAPGRCAVTCLHGIETENEAAQGAAGVFFAHETFADEEAVVSFRTQAGSRIDVVYAALADFAQSFRQSFGHTERVGNVGNERPEVAVVHAADVRAKLRIAELVLPVQFEQHLKAKSVGRVNQPLALSAVKHRGYEEHRRRPAEPRLEKLVLVNDEVLVQHGQRDSCLPCLRYEAVGAAEEPPVGQDTYGRSPAPLVFHGHFGGLRALVEPSL